MKTGVSQHRVLPGHTEQNGRVVKCFELLSQARNVHEKQMTDLTSSYAMQNQMERNSFVVQAYDLTSTSFDLPLPSFVVLRLVHSGTLKNVVVSKSKNLYHCVTILVCNYRENYYFFSFSAFPCINCRSLVNYSFPKLITQTSEY